MNCFVFVKFSIILFYICSKRQIKSVWIRRFITHWSMQFLICCCRFSSGTLVPAMYCAGWSHKGQSKCFALLATWNWKCSSAGIFCFGTCWNIDIMFESCSHNCLWMFLFSTVCSWIACSALYSLPHASDCLLFSPFVTFSWLLNMTEIITEPRNVVW